MLEYFKRPLPNLIHSFTIIIAILHLWLYICDKNFHFANFRVLKILHKIFTTYFWRIYKILAPRKFCPIYIWYKLEISCIAILSIIFLVFTEESIRGSIISSRESWSLRNVQQKRGTRRSCYHRPQVSISLYIFVYFCITCLYFFDRFMMVPALLGSLTFQLMEGERLVNLKKAKVSEEERERERKGDELWLIIIYRNISLNIYKDATIMPSLLR